MGKGSRICVTASAWEQEELIGRRRAQHEKSARKINTKIRRAGQSKDARKEAGLPGNGMAETGGT